MRERPILSKEAAARGHALPAGLPYAETRAIALIGRVCLRTLLTHRDSLASKRFSSFNCLARVIVFFSAPVPIAIVKSIASLVATLRAYGRFRFVANVIENAIVLPAQRNHLHASNSLWIECIRARTFTFRQLIARGVA